MLRKSMTILGLTVAVSISAYAQDVTVLQTDKIEVIGKTSVHILNESELGWRLAAIAIPILAAVFAALFANWLATRREEKSRESDVYKTKIALLHELSSRVAHCIYDYEVPWCNWGKVSSSESATLKRVLKFKPVLPVMYPPDTATFGRMTAATASALVNFYTALGRWQREIVDAEHSAIEIDGQLKLPPGDLMRLSRRLGETLGPGRDALQALAEDIGSEAHEIIKANFVAYYRFAVPNDSRSKRVIDMQPFALLDEFVLTARSQKEEEQQYSFMKRGNVVDVPKGYTISTD